MSSSGAVAANNLQPLRKRSAIQPSDDDAPIVGGRMWAASGNHFTPCEEARDKLPPGNYRIAVTDRGIYFVKRGVETDALLELPDSATEKILAAMKVFWTREAAYDEYGFIWKRGIMLYGPPGGGKTSTIELLSNILIKDMHGIVVHVDDPGAAVAGLEAFRFIEPETPLLMVIEDIDAVIQNRNESALLNLLDGEFQTKNIVVIATTNYPERIDKRIMNRPSRFDVLVKIDLPTAPARKMYLERTNKRFQRDPEGTKEELAKWVADTNGFSVAHLKELIIAVEVLGETYTNSLARLKEMLSIKLSSTDTGSKLGFA